MGSSKLVARALVRLATTGSGHNNIRTKAIYMTLTAAAVPKFYRSTIYISYNHDHTDGPEIK